MVENPAVPVELFKKVYPFRMLPDEAASAVERQTRLLEFSETDFVYKEGDEANALYLVVAGDVELNLDAPEEGDNPYLISVLHMGDLFGWEVMEGRAIHRCNAVALDGAKVARIDEIALVEAMHDAPYLQTALKLMLDSFLLSLHTELPWREEDEAVLYMARKHPIFLWVKLAPALFFFLVSVIMTAYLALANIPGMIILGIFLIGIVILSGGWGIWVYVDWSNDYSIITGQRVAYQERVVMLYDSRQEAPLETVLASTTNTSQLGRILGYGDLVLKTYTGTIIFPAISKPEVVAQYLQDRRGFMQAAQRQADLREVHRVVEERIFPKPPAPPVEPEVGAETIHTEDGDEDEVVEPAPRLTKPGRERLANLLQMRFEEGGIITYRQHWLILLRQVFLPLLLILGLLLLLAFGATAIFSLLSVQAAAALIVLAVLLLMFWLWYQYEDWANDQYILTADQLVDVYKKPLGEEEKRSAPLKNIQSVEFEKLGIVGLILNYGTVFIRIGDTQFTFDNVFNPSDVQREIFRRMEALNYREKKKETDTVREGILDLLEAYHHLQQENTKKEDQDKGQSKEVQPFD